MEKLYETEQKPKQIFLVGIRDTRTSKEISESLDKEIRALIYTLGLEICGNEIVTVREKQPKFGMGSGKASDIVEKAVGCNADCLIFDLELSPSQQKHWEEISGIPVLDRQELVIRIFANHAKTREAELQVKLAELEYSLPRLTHKYIDLSRQRGGHYGTRGSGETKLETDRRRVQQQIQKLEKDLEEIKKQRETRRKQRKRQSIPVCAIVGYTNSGKSSIFNALTSADMLVEDKLFATLDTATKRFEYKPGSTALLSDTVGFIRRLPHSLIKAFRSTLEEAALANLLIHVLDVSDPDIKTYSQTTLAVLTELGAENIPVITVLNKIDKFDENSTQLETLKAGFPDCVITSAINKTGLTELKQKINDVLNSVLSIDTYKLS